MNCRIAINDTYNRAHWRNSHTAKCENRLLPVLFRVRGPAGEFDIIKAGPRSYTARGYPYPLDPTRYEIVQD